MVSILAVLCMVINVMEKEKREVQTFTKHKGTIKMYMNIRLKLQMLTMFSAYSLFTFKIKVQCNGFIFILKMKPLHCFVFKCAKIIVITSFLRSSLLLRLCWR